MVWYSKGYRVVNLGAYSSSTAAPNTLSVGCTGVIDHSRGTPPLVS